MKKGVGRSTGTFGELAQGEKNGQPFLFTLPVPLTSKVWFVPTHSPGVRSDHPYKRKAIYAAELALKRAGMSVGGTLYFSSQIPVSKGMASSSADITAAVRAVAMSVGIDFTDSAIAEIAAAVEPTDGVMYQGINAVNQKTGELLYSYPNFPELFLIGYDSGGRLNTQQYYRMKGEYSAAAKLQMAQLFDEMHDSLLSGSVPAILSAVTKSAKLNEELLPKPFFSLFAELAKRFELGVIVGHSGTVIGLLCHRYDPSFLEKMSAVKQIIKQKTGWKPFISVPVPASSSSS